MSKPKFKIGDRVKLDGDEYCLAHYGIPESYAKKIGTVSRQYQSGSILVEFDDGRRFFAPNYLGIAINEKIIIYRNGAEVIAKNTATGETGVAKCNPADEFDFETGAEIAFYRLLGDSVHHNFKVGDRVIGTKAADNMYGITNAGWKGVVKKKCSCGDIVVVGVDDDNCKVQFCVCPNYFKLDKTEIPKPQYYTGELVCTKSATNSFTKGKIYKVHNGVLDSNAGIYEYHLFTSFDDVLNTLSSEFIELIEE